MKKTKLSTGVLNLLCNIHTSIVLLMLTVLCSINVMAQTNPTAQALPYTQNFGTLAHTATAYPAGWQGWTICTASCSNTAYKTNAGSANEALVASGDASMNASAVYNYNGKLGILMANGNDVALALAISTTGFTSVSVNYDVMTIRNPYNAGSNTRIGAASLQYRVGTTGAFTNLAGLDYQNNTTLQNTAVTTPQNQLSRTITLPAACDNQAVVQLRWVQRDVSGAGARASFAVDNISINGTAPPCTTPTASPTSLSMTASSATAASGSFTAASGADSYLVIASVGAFTGAGSITDGTAYTAGNTIGNGQVIQSSSSTSITIASGLTGNRTYTINVFSQNSACTGGPKYKTTSPLNGTFTTCPAVPGSPTVSSLTSNSFTLSWASSLGSGATAVTYTVDVSTNSTFTAPVSGSPFTVNDPTVSQAVSGLTQNVIYYYRVRANGSCNSAYTTTGNVTTPCPSVTTMPFSEGFNTITATPPTCWDTTLVTDTEQWSFADEDGDAQFTPHAGTAMAVKNWTGNASNALLVSPPFDLSAQPTQQVRLNVWIHRNDLGVNNDRIRFYANTSPSLSGATTLIDVRTLYTSAPAVAAAGWYNYIANIPLSFNTGGNFFIIAEGNTTGSTSSYSVGFDDFLVENVPTCFAPTAPQVTASTSVTADFSWTASVSSPADGYYWEVRTSGAGGSGATGLTTSGTTAAGVVTAGATGLTANTSYTFYVRAVCNANDSSSFASLAFTTPCAATNVPYTQDFESATVPAIPTCTSIQNAGSGNDWITSSAPGSGFTSRTLAYQYSASSAANAWWYTQGINLTGGNTYKLTYRYGNNSSTFIEDLEVKYGSSPVNSSMTDLLATHAGIIGAVATTNSVTFVPSVTGVYYIGYHCYSIADQFNLYVDDISLVELPPCSGTPGASSTQSTLTTVCPATNFTLSLTPSYENTGITYQWQSSTDGVTYTDISGATSSTYTGNQSAMHYYQAIVTCTNGGANITSSPIQITNTALASCYCIPSYSTGCANDKITNFDLGTLSNNSGTACSTSPAGYVLYGTTPSNLTTTLVPGQSYTATISTTNTANANGTGVAIWIDYNDNGAFEASEKSDNGATKFASNATGTITVNIPSTAPVGQHRLRVVAARNTLSNAVGACTPGNAAGETEDYTVMIGNCISAPTYPANGGSACAFASGTELSWPAYSGATEYDVYFGTTNPPTTLVADNLAALTYNVGALSTSSTYYWIIVPQVAGATTCTPWSFSVNPAPVVNISSNSPTCSGTSLSFSSNNAAPGQSTGNTFAWTGPNSFTSTLQSFSVSGTVANSGMYVVTITNQFGCAAKDSLQGDVAPNPTLSVVSQDDITCFGYNDGVVTVSAANGSPDYVYNDGNNFNLDGIFTGLAPGPITIYVSDANSCESQITVTVNEPAAVAATAGNDGPVCINTPVNLSSTGSGGTGTLTYSWSGPGGYTSSDQNPSIAGTTLGNAGTYTVTVMDANGCTGFENTVVVINDVPAQPVTITGAPASVCPPSGTYTLSTSAADADTYNWYLAPNNNGVSFLSANGSSSMDVNFQTTTNSGYAIRVDATNECGTSVFTGVFVRVSTSTPAALTGDAFACANDTKTYSHNAVTGATSYQWNAPAGCYFDGNPLNVAPYVTSGTSVDITFPAGYTGGVIGVASQVACFTSVYRNLTVSNAPPVASVISGATSICSPQSGVAYSVINVNGLTYSWTAPANAIIASGQGTSSVMVNYLSGFAGGQLQVVANSPCGSGSPRKLNVSVSAGGGVTARPVSITGQVANLCSAANITFTANPAVSGATYVFTTNVAGASVSPGVANNQAVISFPGAWTTGQVSVTQQNACASVSLPRIIDIKAKPNAPLISGPTAVAPNSTGMVYSVPAVSPSVTYIWYVPAGATIASGQGTSSITVNFGATIGPIKCYEGNSCGNATGVLNVASARFAAGAAESSFPDLKAFPNPASEFITIEFTAADAGNASIQVTDLSGKVISTVNEPASKGINSLNYSVKSLAKGMYMISVRTSSGVTQTRVAVQ